MTIRLRLTIFNAIILILTLLAALSVGATFVGLYIFRDPWPLVSAPAHELAYRIGNGEVFTAEQLEDFADDRYEVSILDADGNIMLSSSTPHSVLSANESPIWRDGPAIGEPVEREISTPDGETFANVLPIRSNGVVTGYVDVRTSYEAYAVAVIEDYIFVPIIAAALVPIALVLILISYVLTWRALRPVNRIAKEANSISETDLSRRLPVQGGKRDEFARLAIAFNNLLDRIQRNMLEREGVLEAQRRFVADAGHELRTPLTSIRGYARMLDEWGLEDEKVAREGIQIIEREATRLGDLAEGLLIVARGDEQAALNLENGDLRAPVQEAIDAIRLNSPETVIEAVVPEAPVMAAIDANRVRQLVTILLDNAIKYSPSGSTVTVIVALSGGVPTLAVRDSGIGIAEENLPRIFERFYRADESRGNRGAGLGLSIAHQIVMAHGGRITVQSYVGHGTRFTVTFRPPRTPADRHAPGRKRSAVRSLLERLRRTTPAKS
ncbi:MAG: HAMP domain-containing histidine kinase [Chloroflexota bacterium]|nr:HAMP domain-containing histidine kinase [Chloroflexota bacterium]